MKNGEACKNHMVKLARVNVSNLTHNVGPTSLSIYNPYIKLC